jgi:hypothetical protein
MQIEKPSEKQKLHSVEEKGEGAWQGRFILYSHKEYKRTLYVENKQPKTNDRYR